MFGRVLTLHVRLEKKPEFSQKISPEIASILKSSPGLQQVTVLQDEVELDKFLIVTLWKTREDAERYHRAHFDRMCSIIEPYLTFPPMLNKFKVDESINGLLPAHFELGKPADVILQ